MNENVVIMGASGASGQRIARALAARGIPLTLAGRNRGTLAPLAGELGAAVAEADIARPGPVLRQARMVVNTVGPFASQAPATRRRWSRRSPGSEWWSRRSGRSPGWPAR